jgi:glycosyltransferase involved in cell wall biosynthesis
LYRFSIITVTFNSQNTIYKTIKSINSQAFKNFEYIIIDGGSSDKTLQIIKNSINHKIKILSKKDNGIYHAMNKGIKIANGEYIGFLNSDDWLNKNTLRDVDKLINKIKPPIIYGDAIFYENNKKKFYAKARLDKLNQNMSLLHSSLYIRRDIIKKNLFNQKLIISSDYEQLLNLYKKYNFSYLKKSLSNVSLGGKSSNLSISSKEFFKIQNKKFNFLYAIYNYIKKYHYHLLKIFFFFFIKKS